MSRIVRKPVLTYANNKGADQPAHPRSLISTFVVRCLDSIIPLVSISEISRLYLASAAEQACLNLTWLKPPEDTFSSDVAHMTFCSHSYGSSFSALLKFRNLCPHLTLISNSETQNLFLLSVHTCFHVHSVVDTLGLHFILW